MEKNVNATILEGCDNSSPFLSLLMAAPNF